MPLLPPVTTATFPASFFDLEFLLWIIYVPFGKYVTHGHGLSIGLLYWSV